MSLGFCSIILWDKYHAEEAALSDSDAKAFNKTIAITLVYSSKLVAP